MSESKLRRLKPFTFSLEVFPPKKEIDDLSALETVIKELVDLNPDFISVTYGAGGSTNKNTVRVAQYIKHLGIEPLAHLTCANETEEGIQTYCNELLSSNISTIMCLRGDNYDVERDTSFTHATDLMTYIQKHFPLEVAGACYPEMHKESVWLDEDIQAYLLKEKAGAQFLITQLFFDNSYFYSMIKNARNKGLTIPVIPGIMPIIDAHQFIRIRKLTHANIPESMLTMFETYKDDKDAMFELGIHWASLQIIDLLAHGVDGIHLYTMNNPRVAHAIQKRIQPFIKN